MRAGLEALALDTVKDHFAAEGESEWEWGFASGTDTVRITARNGLPQSPFESPSALFLYVKPEDVPADAERGDLLTEAATGQSYRVVEIIRRRSSQTVVTVEKVK